jgi:hypothetical protein
LSIGYRVLEELNWCSRGAKGYFSRLKRQLKRIKHANQSCAVRISPPDKGETALCSGTSHSSALGSAPFFVSGGGVIWGPPCSGVIHATALHVSSSQSKPRPSLSMQKYEIGVEERERQWADRVLECLNNAGD